MDQRQSGMDLVNRLRRWRYVPKAEHPPLMEEAALEVERLKARVLDLERGLYVSAMQYQQR